MLEMLPHITDANYKKKIVSAVDAIMLSLIKNYSNKQPVKGHALLNEGVYSWHDKFGIEEGNIWGDYFYVEARCASTIHHGSRTGNKKTHLYNRFTSTVY
ncbi:hypothetical protein MGH68_00970 [Erysipelothrix sp. D19-032]